MPGKKSDSERYARWAALTLEESGGFAGLRRGSTLHREQLTPAQAARVAVLLARLGEPAGALAASSTLPDAQQLCVEMACGSGEGSRCWRFDTADLPEALDELLTLAPPLRPLPPPCR